MTDDVPIKAAKNTFEIVDALVELEGARVSELAARFDKPTSTIHDYLRTLETEGYLVKEDDRYHVSTRFLAIGEQARSRQKIYHIAGEEVDELAEQTGEHTNLMIEEHGLGVFLYRSRGEKAVQLDTHSGMSLHMHTTSMGKSILAHRPESEVEEILDEHGLPEVTDQTITDRGELFDELAEIRERGYAYDDEERVKGMRCVAAPITNNEEYAIAAMSVSGPKSRLRGDRFREEVPELILKATNVIEVNLTYS